MGNVLETCPNGILLSDINLNDPSLSCINVKYVIVGDGYRHSIVVSEDGNRWVGLGKTIFSNNGNGITYNNITRLWVAVGTGNNSIATSNNGMRWIGLGNTIFTTGNKVKYANNLFVAVGLRNDNVGIPPTNGTNTIATSTDGTIWTIRKPSFLNSGRQIIYGKDISGNNLWAAFGDSNYNNQLSNLDGLYTRIIVSSNGVGWSRTVINPSTGQGQEISASISNLGYGNSVWMGNNSKNIEMSKDGKIWTRTSSVDTIMTGEIKGIAYDRINNLWVLVGEGTNQIATSRDRGVTWTGLGKTFFKYGAYFVKYVNDTLFVGGSNNAGGTEYNILLSSTNGTNWNVVNNFNLLYTCSDIEYATPLLECTSTAGYSGTAGECTCALGYSGTVTYRNGVLGGCTAIPCTTAGYTGTAGACTCASGYSGTVTYTNGVLGGCISLFSVIKTYTPNTMEYAITITQSRNTTQTYTLDDAIPYSRFSIGFRIRTLPSAGCSNSNLTFEFYGDGILILTETFQYIGSTTRGSNPYKKLTLKIITTSSCDLNNYTGFTFIINKI